MNILVRSLSKITTKETLEALFAKFGAVNAITIVNDNVTGASKGFGFVEMPNEAEAQKAISGLNARLVDGVKIRVKVAEPKPVVQESLPKAAPKRALPPRSIYPTQKPDDKGAYGTRSHRSGGNYDEKPSAYRVTGSSRSDYRPAGERKYNSPRSGVANARPRPGFPYRAGTGYKPRGERDFGRPGESSFGYSSGEGRKPANKPPGERKFSPARGGSISAKPRPGFPVREGARPGYKPKGARISEHTGVPRFGSSSGEGRRPEYKAAPERKYGPPRPGERNAKSRPYFPFREGAKRSGGQFKKR